MIQIVVGDIIRNVLVFGVYDKLLGPLGQWGYPEHKQGSKGQVRVWPYNWVRGIPENAKRLASDIRMAVQQYPDKNIVLLAHSMGGLVCTYALECLSDPDDAWRDHVRLLVTFGTPFRGAPESLKNAFGIEGVMGITGKDCQQLMADPRFPSGYQLLPHLSTSASWSSQPPLQPVSNYQSLNPSGPPLGPANLNAALGCQHALQHGTAAPNTRKFNFCGSRHHTVWSVGTPQGTAGVLVPYASKAGDGTVPSWSGRQRDSVQFAPLGTKHRTTFGDDDLLDVLHALLSGANSPTGPAPGLGKLAAGQSAPAPRSQPRVSVTQNAISSLAAEVEIEVLDPPQEDTLHLAWMQLHDVETRDDVRRHLATADFNTVVAQRSLPMGAEIGFPLLISIPRPKHFGQYALVGWSGEPTKSLGDLNADAIDVVWVFADEGHGGSTKGSRVSVVDAPDAPLGASSA